MCNICITQDTSHRLKNHVHEIVCTLNPGSDPFSKMCPPKLESSGGGKC